MRRHDEQPAERRRQAEPRQSGATPAAAVRAPDTVRQPGAELGPGAVLDLQRSLGNEHVLRLLAGEGEQHESPVDGSAVRDVLRSPGRPLDTGTRDEFEARLGADLGDVRVHTGPAAERSSAEIGARAYTSGEHVVVGAAGGDKHTMAHELTHVLQQRQGPVAGQPAGAGLRVSDPADEFERAAEATATAVMRRPVPDRAPAVQRASGHRDGGLVAQRMNAATPPAPQLAGNVLGGESLEGDCGYFQRVRQWNLQNSVEGVIIQEVTRTFAVERYDDATGTWAQIAGAALDGYVRDPDANVHAGDTHYWEMWMIGPAGGFGKDGKKDTFGLTALIPDQSRLHDTTRGGFTIRGEARFYPTSLKGAALGFSRGAVPAAGALNSRNTSPAADLAAAGLTAAGQPVIYQVVATWDSATAGTNFVYQPDASGRGNVPAAGETNVVP